MAGMMAGMGATGPTGPQGPQGPEGITGMQGSMAGMGATGATGPQGAVALLFVEAATGVTGSPTFGPFSYENNDTLRIIGGTGVSVTGVAGPSGPAISISSSSVYTGRTHRYFATGFSGVTNSSAFVRSYIPNNISIVKNPNFVSMSGFLGATGVEYIITIPANDEICHFSLTDKSTLITSAGGSNSIAIKLTFQWLDTSATWNNNGTTLPTPLYPTFIFNQAGTGSSPLVNFTTALTYINNTIPPGVTVFPSIPAGPNRTISFDCFLSSSVLNWFIVSCGY
jgi:hypothetical protein